jgi:hypothetical protein
MAWLICFSCFSYNPLERREVCKGGGREVSKKSAHSQPSNKGGSTSHRPQPSHAARRNDVSTANPANHAAAKATRPPAAAVSPAYDQQVLLSSKKMLSIGLTYELLYHYHRCIDII